MGEVDDDLGSGIHKFGQRIADVHTRREGEVLRVLHGLNHGRADLALGAQHCDSHRPTLMGVDRRVLDRDLVS